MSFFMTDAFAAAADGAAGAPQGNPMGSFVMLGAFVLIFYLLLWRPQHKRTKAHRELLHNLSVGDEVVTSGGMLGKIEKIQDEFIAIVIAEGTTIKVQRPAVVAALPKGTIKSI